MATVSARTTPTVACAGLGHRYLAYAVDILLLYGLSFALQFAVVALLGRPVGDALGHPDSGALLWGWTLLTHSAPIWAYFALSEAAPRGATLGKRLLGLRVTDTAGRRLGAGRSWHRTIAKLGIFELGHVGLFFPAPLFARDDPPFPIPVIGLLALLLVYVVTLALTPRRQSVHDLIAGTVVVRRRAGRAGAD